MAVSIKLIDASGEVLGNFDLRDAEKMAKAEGKTLMVVNKQQQIYKIVDMGKLKYDAKQKNKQKNAQKKANKVKEIKLRPGIGAHDLDIKYNHIVEFLNDGLKTKIIMSFRGRLAANKTIGLDKFNQLVNKLVDSKIGVKDKDASFDGPNLSVVVSPSK